MPNLTVEMCRSWIDNKHELSKETARKWLHILGFKQLNHQNILMGMKGMTSSIIENNFLIN